MLEDERSTILIVDDKNTNILILNNILKDDYKIEEARTKEEALKKIKINDIDLVLIDVQMRDEIAYELCKKIKEEPKTKRIPIIFLSSKNSEDDEEFGLNLGAIDYIIQPYSKVILKARIRNQIVLKEQTELLEKLSMYDALTNIKNRRYFDEVFKQAYSDIKRENTNLALMMIDIDFFKLYNDNYGHGKGDEALRKVAKILEKSLNRANDLVARYGGEEFVVLLKSIDLAGLEHISNILVEAVRNENIEHEFSKVSQNITISLGAVLYESDRKLDALEIMKLADEALYEAKNSGRNKSIVKVL
ncbi:Phytochrome-like protein cph2 [Aliarcobacter thereius]|uniref:diguanylate cyclase n=2 Tax=Aliarcobacter thereius TaxID=544718 RepID=A0A1C0B6H6_9BACT|nr:diguanylate cyclase [Aliarcobacter thereius]OCL86736.1 Phytochrome-like protein cph2 [Aliarcobacter thereius]OCL90938.1 Phytochrome-like protein cph2 [Aliarcobacter thereius]OCL96233.1 Phytochrome-like protein cph2 [Aliarcobacter thereius LMG 24486]OCL98905.1 Phytochrome-like protein cph2 [Aliarcobacter thereius]QBF15802.1 two-component system response regulator/diguanylate cyclase [Aliarcobacter thereius LMG 24486]